MAITDITIKADLDIAKRGFYIDACYRHGDTGTPYYVTYGPFPENKREMYIEFLNVIRDTAQLYQDKSTRYATHRIKVKNYKLWFDRDKSSGTPTDDFRVSMGLKSEMYMETFEWAAQLIEFKAYYRDGLTFAKYLLDFIEE